VDIRPSTNPYWWYELTLVVTPLDRPAVSSESVARLEGRVLVADDQADIVHSLRLLLRRLGLEVEGVSSPDAVLEKLPEGFDMLIVDLNYTRDTTSGQEGLNLLDRIREVAPGVPVVVMTGWGTIELAVEAMRRGARDFFQKPWENERVAAVVRTQLELRRALRAVDRLSAENRTLRETVPSFIAQSDSMKRVLDLVSRVAPSDATVLVTGENGTGKGVVASLIHASSPRASKPLITVDLGALSETLLESELFGHVRGAFTDARTEREGRFELADGGTIFLDEIANLSSSHQSKLLRILETGAFERVGSSRPRRVDVRVVAATNADLEAEVAAGRFRQDLRFRLNTVEIRVPPLRERPADISALSQHFLAHFARKYRRPLHAFAPDALVALARHPWPGNVRELAHAIERGVLLSSTEVMTAADLALSVPASAAAPVDSFDQLTLEDMQKQIIVKAIARFSGNVEQAAAALGLSRSALYRRTKKLGL
jgi:DNA-binding NtrC family response regulator